MSKLSLIPLSAMELPDQESGKVPEWVHLVPKGEFRAAHDDRGPWHYRDAQDVILASFSARKRIHIDLNHSTDTAAKAGLDAPAVGYVTEMEERETGIWGKVDWTMAGKALLSDRAYWGISPVIAFDKTTGAVRAIARAALTNDPAVAELTPLSTKETEGMFLKTVAKMLGLGEDASEEDVTAALKKKLDGKDKGSEALAALSTVAEALGAQADASPEALLATVKTLKAGASESAETIATLQTRVKSLEDGGKKKAAEDFVDGAIRDRRVGVKAARDEYVTLHVENPVRTEKMISALPKLDSTHTTDVPPEPDGEAALSASENLVAGMLGIDPKKMAETKAAEAKRGAF
ncbi:MAG: hypothetical protein EP318_06245 [Rhodobacteraceae bacterium]|nr:MAG: hypothetical protein EP318_06245 [Paracoccaceae bacterium]